MALTGNWLWNNGGYEGRWTGSGLGRIGRIWMQPSARYDLSRTFIVPAAGMVSTSGTIRKDPSAENQASCSVRILLNSKQVWPAEGWAEISPRYDSPTTYEVKNLRVSPGDKLRFMREAQRSESCRSHRVESVGRLSKLRQLSSKNYLSLADLTLRFMNIHAPTVASNRPSCRAMPRFV